MENGQSAFNAIGIVSNLIIVGLPLAFIFYFAFILRRNKRNLVEKQARSKMMLLELQSMSIKKNGPGDQAESEPGNSSTPGPNETNGGGWDFAEKKLGGVVPGAEQLKAVPLHSPTDQQARPEIKPEYIEMMLRQSRAGKIKTPLVPVRTALSIIFVLCAILVGLSYYSFSALGDLAPTDSILEYSYFKKNLREGRIKQAYVKEKVTEFILKNGYQSRTEVPAEKAIADLAEFDVPFDVEKQVESYDKVKVILAITLIVFMIGFFIELKVIDGLRREIRMLKS